MNKSSSYRFDHLERLSDHRGLFEHADRTVRRLEHGYCTDDNARLLVVALREPDDGVPHRLGRLALAFVLDAQDGTGRFRNRMISSGRWTDRGETKDWWGRAVWALGSAAADHSDPVVRQQAMGAFRLAVSCRSRWPRAMAFAALGAAEVVASDPSDALGRALLVDALEAIPAVPAGPWAWPEPRLTYANATLAEAVIAAGAALGRQGDVERGLAMLGWLLELETRSGHLSVTGVGGRSARYSGPQFDQQPIEVSALADACWRAYAITGDSRWAEGVSAAAAWFAGKNDVGLVMHDACSGGGFDGLQHASVNENQGAESTLAFISTMQRARSFVTTA